MLQEGFLPKPVSSFPQPALASPENNSNGGFFSDFVGISGSILCLIHCIAPQLLFLGTLGLGMASIFSSGWWHLLFWITCFFAVWKSSKISPVKLFRVVLWAAFSLFTVGIALDFFMGVENLFSYAGSAMLVFGHGWNLWRLSRKPSPKVVPN